MEIRPGAHSRALHWLACLFLALAPALCAATSISVVGNSGYSVTGSTVVLTADKVQNNATGGSSGTLKMELWAFPSPYTGASQSGYQLAEYTLGVLSGGYNYNGISSGSVPYSPPASGTWYYALIVSEYNNGSWPAVAWVNFSSTVTCQNGSCVNNSPTTTTSTTAPTQSPSFTFTGSVVDTASQAVAGAQVYFVANGQTYSATTDASGRFSLVFNPTNIPTTLAYWVTKTGYIPLAKNLTLSGTSASAGTLSLEALSGAAVVLEVVPDVHHLGDNSYSGSFNSQFQKSGTEGLTFTKTFTVSSAQTAGTGATLTLLAKGLQDPNTLLINNRLIGYLSTSPSDGSYGTASFSVAMSTFIAGTNTLTIRAAPDSSGNGYDDFEFTNVVIRFAGVSTTATTTTAGTGTVSTTAADCLFNWAERYYPELFSPAGAPSKSFNPYYYRYYSGKNSYLAISGNDQSVWYMGPLSGNQVLNVGLATNWYRTAGCG